MRVSVFVCLYVVCRATTTFALEIASCGQTVPAGEVGVLQTDLECLSATDGVVLETHATLRMNGHAIRNVSPFPGGPSGIHCKDSCLVTGPGEIVGPFGHGIRGPKGTLIVEQLTIRDIYGDGIEVSTRKGLQGKVVATGVTAQNNRGAGVSAYRIRADQVSVTGNRGSGLSAHLINGDAVTADHNGGSGISALRRVKLSRLKAQENATAGVSAVSCTLRDSTVTQNLWFGEAVDIVSQFRPRLTNTRCDRSRKLGSLSSWGVCTKD